MTKITLYYVYLLMQKNTVFYRNSILLNSEHSNFMSKKRPKNKAVPYATFRKLVSTLADKSATTRYQSNRRQCILRH